MAMTDAEKLGLALDLAGACDQTGEAARLMGSAYLPAARDAILAARNPFSADPSAETWEARYDRLQCEVAAAMYDRRGAEGETAHSENGVSRTWGSAGVPRHLMQRVVPRGKVPG